MEVLEELDSAARRGSPVIAGQQSGQASQAGQPPPSRPRDGFGPLYYTGLRDPLGGRRADQVRKGITAVDAWVRWLAEQAAQVEASQRAFDRTIADTKSVTTAFDRDLKANGFRKLSKASGTLLQTRLAEYERASSEVQAFSEDVRSSALRLAIADARLTLAEKKLELHDLQRRQDAEESTRGQIEADLKPIEQFVDHGAAFLKDPAGKLQELGWEAGKALARELLTSDYERRLAEIDVRVRAIDGRRGRLGDDIVAGDVTVAIQSVREASSLFNATNGRLELAKRQQVKAIDHLADLERDNPETTTVFRKLQSYNAILMKAAEDLNVMSQAYVACQRRSGGRLAYADEIYMLARQDLSILHGQALRQYPTPDQERTERQAKAIADYANSVAGWHAREIAEHHELQGALWRNEHTAHAARLVRRIQEEGLGHTKIER